MSDCGVMGLFTKLSHKHAETCGAANGDGEECMESVDSTAAVGSQTGRLCSCDNVLW